MFCDSCGTPLQSGQSFCAKCGKAIIGGAQPWGSRVARHAQMLGILWIAYSALLLLVGMLMIVVFQHVLPGILRYEPPQQQGPPPGVVFGLLRPVMHVVAVLILVKAAAGIAAGIGVLQRAGWSRILTLVLACVSLLSLPFGTALGVYSLWVLLSPNAEAEFHGLARDAAVVKP